MNRWPERRDNHRLFSHNLVTLAEEADVFVVMETAATERTSLGIAFLIAKDWTNETRYDPREFPEIRARDMLTAVDGGLLSWLLKR